MQHQHKQVKQVETKPNVIHTHYWKQLRRLWDTVSGIKIYLVDRNNLSSDMYAFIVALYLLGQ